LIVAKVAKTFGIAAPPKLLASFATKEEKTVNRARSKLFWMALIVLAVATCGPAAEQQGEQQRSEVLNDNTLLRTWMVFRTPVVIDSDGQLGTSTVTATMISDGSITAADLREASGG
jgi:hypothetical protein